MERLKTVSRRVLAGLVAARQKLESGEAPSPSKGEVAKATVRPKVPMRESKAAAPVKEGG